MFLELIIHVMISYLYGWIILTGKNVLCYRMGIKSMVSSIKNLKNLNLLNFIFYIKYEQHKSS
jgi:hypothetical protein